MLLDDRGKLRNLYATALLEDVIPFWLRRAPDREHGGHFTCLDREGRVYDTLKAVWLQGRHAWMFSKLYRVVDQRPEYLWAAESAARFLADHGRDERGDWWLWLNREGAPIGERRDFFSACFSALGLAEFGRASGQARPRDLAIETFERIVRQVREGQPELGDQGPEDPLMRPMSVPMILVNLCEELGSATGHPVEDVLTESVSAIMDRHVDPEAGLIYERVAADGSHPDTPDGHLINPGHGIEAMWFVMLAAEKRGDRALIDRAADALEGQLAAGWDEEYGGLYSFVDLAEGKPPRDADWTGKRWWVHSEALVALVVGWHLTGRESLGQWYDRVHDYVWPRFADAECGEWFMGLDRAGEPAETAKGSPWKGCFHIPRAMLVAMRVLERGSGEGMGGLL